MLGVNVELLQDFRDLTTDDGTDTRYGLWINSFLGFLPPLNLQEMGQNYLFLFNEQFCDPTVVYRWCTVYLCEYCCLHTIV